MSTNPCMEMKVGLLKGTVDEAVVEVGVGGGGGGGAVFLGNVPLHSDTGGRQVSGMEEGRCVCVCVCVCV